MTIDEIIKYVSDEKKHADTDSQKATIRNDSTAAYYFNGLADAFSDMLEMLKEYRKTNA